MAAARSEQLHELRTISEHMKEAAKRIDVWVKGVNCQR